MSRRRSRRLWRSPWVFAAAAILFASGLAAGGVTLASFTAETENGTATFAGGWIGAASNPTVTPSGYNGLLAWTPATHGLTGQAVWGYDNGTTATCATATLTAAVSSSATTITVSSAAGFPVSGNYAIQVDNEQMTVTAGQTTTTWTVTRGVNGTTAVAHSAGAPVQLGQRLGTTASATTTAYTDSSTLVDNPRSGVNGHYVCYTLVSTRSGTGWTAASSFPVTVLGLVPTGIAVSGTTLNSGSTITLTYNQAVAYSGGNIEVCIVSGTLTFGSRFSCTSTMGTLTGGTANRSATCTASTVAASASSIVVTLATCNQSATESGGPVTFTPAGTTVTSSVGGVAQCTTSLCKPQISVW